MWREIFHPFGIIQWLTEINAIQISAASIKNINNGPHVFKDKFRLVTKGKRPWKLAYMTYYESHYFN